MSEGTTPEEVAARRALAKNDAEVPPEMRSLYPFAEHVRNLLAQIDALRDDLKRLEEKGPLS